MFLIFFVLLPKMVVGIFYDFPYLVCRSIVIVIIIIVLQSMIRINGNNSIWYYCYHWPILVLYTKWLNENSATMITGLFTCLTGNFVARAILEYSFHINLLFSIENCRLSIILVINFSSYCYCFHIE